MKLLVAGPPCAGKTTIALALSQHLGYSLFVQDFDKESRFASFGYTSARANHIYRSGGAAALHKYEAQFELADLRRELARRAAAIFDLGGGIVLQHQTQKQDLLLSTIDEADLCFIAIPHPNNPEQAFQALSSRLDARSASDSETSLWCENGGIELTRALLTAALEIRHSKARIIDTSLDFVLLELNRVK